MTEHMTAHAPLAIAASHLSGDAVTELTQEMSGRWLVRTKGSRHVWDLQAGTYTRLPGPGKKAFAFDGVPVSIARVAVWPAVGASSLLFFDDPQDPTIEQWRVCSTIRSITPLTSTAS